MNPKAARCFSAILIPLLFIWMPPFFGTSEEGTSWAGTKTIKVSMDVFRSKNLRKGQFKKYTKWKSSNKKIVSVSKKGKLSSLKPGTATITASKGKRKAKWIVTVTNENGRYLSKKYSYDLGWELLDEDRECTLYPKTVRAGKNDTTSTSINVFGLPKESETFIYLDRKLIKSGYVWGLQWDISVSGRTMKPGTHDVTVVQYMNDDPRENPVICLTRSFKLKRPR